MKIYQSPKSVLVKIITSVLSVVFVLLFTAIGLNVEQLGGMTAVGLALLLLLLVILAYSGSLKSVSVTEERLVLNHGIGKSVIDFKDLVSISKVPNANFVLLFGSNGFFGFNGVVYGGTTCHVNDRNHMVRIKTHKKSYLISCDDALLEDSKIKKISL